MLSHFFNLNTVADECLFIWYEYPTHKQELLCNSMDKHIPETLEIISIFLIIDESMNELIKHF